MNNLTRFPGREIFFSLFIILIASQISFSQTFIGRQRVDSFPVTPWNTMSYGLTWLPTDYQSNTTQKYPLIIFLHGRGEVGDGKSGLYNLIVTGLPQLIADGFDPEAVNPVDNQHYKFIVVSPQREVSSQWSYAWEHISNMLPDLLSRYRIDSSRIYVTGLSAGGSGTVSCVTNGIEAAHKFAAIVPIAPAGPNKTSELNELHLVGGTYGSKVWTACGSKDARLKYSTDLTDSINNATPAPLVPALFSSIAGVDHDPAEWNTVYSPSWKTNSNNTVGLSIYEWMLQYKSYNSTHSLCNGIRRELVPAANDSGRIMSGDSNSIWFSPVNPGDTLVLKANDNWSYVSLDNYSGTSACPIVVTNQGGQVWLTKSIKMTSCHYIKVTGSGDANTYYGFRVYNPAQNDQNGVAIEIVGKTTHMEAERVDVYRKTYGVWAKQDPLCDTSFNYPNYRIDDIKIHHCRFKNIGQDCIYAGNTDPLGYRQYFCSADSSWHHFIPMRMSNVSIHHLIIDSCMRTGIQLSGADSGYNEIYENVVTRCGYEHDQQQGAGIAIGGMTRNCHVYNNTISNTFIYGIESFGVGINYIENNTVDSSGYLSDSVNTVSQPSNILVSPKETNPFDSTTIIIRNNKLGVNAAAGHQNIALVNWGPPTWTTQNEVCGNTKLDGHTPATLYVDAGIQYSDCQDECEIHIEAENYTAMYGIQLENTSDVGGGQNVAWQDDGDWMDYSVNIATAGSFTIQFRVASMFTGAQFQLKSGSNVLATMTVPNTGNFQSWQTITAQINLPAGTQTLRIQTTAANGGWNLNWWEISCAENNCSGSSHIEGENYSAMNGIQLENTSDVGGGQNVAWQDDGDWMDYSVNIATAGTYTVQFRVASMFTGAQFQLKSGSNVLATMTVPNTGNFQSWQTINTQINLPAGAQTLRIQTTAANGGWNLNWWEISCPENNCSGSSHIEGEDYSAMNGIQLENTSDVGGGQNVAWQDDGDWMDYSVNIAAAGTYTVKFRVASMFTGAQFQLKNGSNVLATMSVPNTGNFQSWQTISTQVSLSAGAQTLRIQTSAANGGWNLNWWEINCGDLPTQPLRMVTQESIQIPAGLQIFPNPASDRVFLRVNYPQKGRMTIEVLDSYGSTRKITRVQKVNSGSLETPLSLYGLSNGVYFIRVTINGWSGLTRVIKL